MYLCINYVYIYGEVRTTFNTHFARAPNEFQQAFNTMHIGRLSGRGVRALSFLLPPRKIRSVRTVCYHYKLYLKKISV